MNTQELATRAIQNVRPMRFMKEGVTDKIEDAFEYSFFLRSELDLARQKYLDDRPKWLDLGLGVRATYIDPLNNPFMNTELTPEQEQNLINIHESTHAELYFHGKLIRKFTGEINDDYHFLSRGIQSDRIELFVVLESLGDVDKTEDYLRTIRSCFPKVEQDRYRKALIEEAKKIPLQVVPNQPPQVQFSELDLEVIRLALYEYQMFVQRYNIPNKKGPLHIPPVDALHTLMGNVCKDLLERLGPGRSDLLTEELRNVEVIAE